MSLRLVSSDLRSSAAFAGFGLGEDRLAAWLARRARLTGASLLAQLADDGKADESVLPICRFAISSLLLCRRIACALCPGRGAFCSGGRCIPDIGKGWLGPAFVDGAFGGAGRCDDRVLIDERSWRLKLSVSSPVSWRKVQFLLLHCSLRRKDEQYLVVPY